MMDPLAAYASLFAASFLAATAFPFQSELILMGLVAGEEFPWWALLVVATAGNTLGSVVNWLLGRFFLRFLERRWFPVSRQAYEKVERWSRAMACGRCCSPGFRSWAIRSRSWRAPCA
jgi:membrane protein YqaA with SNARE-associated domain